MTSCRRQETTKDDEAFVNDEDSDVDLVQVEVEIEELTGWWDDEIKKEPIDFDEEGSPECSTSKQPSSAPIVYEDDSDSDSPISGLAPAKRQRQSPVKQLTVIKKVCPLPASSWSIDWTDPRREGPLEDHDFARTPGVIAPLNEHPTEYDFFKLIFNDEFWALITDETNRYAEQMKIKMSSNSPLKPQSVLGAWKPVTIGEMKLFFSIILHMTLIKKAKQCEYWSTKMFMSTPFVNSIMPRHRFCAIYACLHINNNEKYVPPRKTNYDPFFKLRPFLDMFFAKSKDFYQAGENLVIAEDTFRYRGRMDVQAKKVKNKMEASAKKVYMLCDAETGYVLNILPYYTYYISKPSEAVTLNFLENHLNKWHTVYMDQVFVTTSMFLTLWNNETRAVGRIGSREPGLPVHLQNRKKPLAPGEAYFHHRGPLTVCKWNHRPITSFARNALYLLTTKHGAPSHSHTKGQKSGKSKPECVADYGKMKTGVDLCDHYVSYYSHKRKTMKWWKRLFFHLIARGIVNAYILHTKSASKNNRKKFEEFLVAVGECLAEDGGADVANEPKTQRLTGQANRLLGRHFPARIPASENKARQICTRMCKVCAEKNRKLGEKRRKETVFYCPDCNIPLCLPECFTKYHTLQDYTE